MKELKSVVGMKDYLGEECKTLRMLENTLAFISSLYGFTEIKTPILEYSEVFLKTLGETSDVVSKEMFVLQDRNGENLVLRPENTAGIMRSFFTEGLRDKLPLKVFYSGPMFRYETPQKGRYRQFNQLGVEVLGINNAQADIEIIELAWTFIKSLNIQNKCVLEINSIGDKESRENYKKILVEYFEANKSGLSKESLERLYKNPLRILDSKDNNDIKLIQNAPKLIDSLSEESLKWFNKVKKGLDICGVPYKINLNLVRGLDYYSETVFEITTEVIGSQNTILAGGRYNDLGKIMGGEEVSGVGFAAGSERLMMMLPLEKLAKLEVAVVPLNDELSEEYGLEILTKLRQNNIFAEMPTNESLNKRMKKADKLGAKFAIIIGETEVKNKTVTVKKLADGTQYVTTINEFINNIKVA